MTPAKREQLDRLIDRIAASLGGGVEPTMLIADEGARFRFSCGAYELRLAGVAGTATSGRKAALESWMRAALRRIAKESTR